jgi:predicted ATP-dependent serine protease
MVHGAGGIFGSMQLLAGGSGIGKTERGARE